MTVHFTCGSGSNRSIILSPAGGHPVILYGWPHVCLGLLGLLSPVRNYIHAIGGWRFYENVVSLPCKHGSDSGGGMTDEPNTVIPTDAIVGLIVVLDRQPSQVEKPSFNQIFGYDPVGRGSRMDHCAWTQNVGRFKVLMRSKQLIHINSDLHLYAINRYTKFRGKGKIMVTFRDDDVRDGSYKNTRSNAILVYVMFECDDYRSMQCNLNSRMTYYH